MADKFMLHEYLEKLGKELSYGTKRRFIIAAALLATPPLLVMDEVYNGLDPVQIRIIQNTLRGYADNGNTVLLSTHILKLAAEVADRVGIIKKGELLVVGEPNVLCNKLGVNDLNALFFKVTGREIEVIENNAELRGDHVELLD